MQAHETRAAGRATSGLDKVKLPHPRIPTCYGFVHGFKRLTGVGLDLATLVSCVILTQWSRKGGYGAGGIVASIVLLCNDVAQCAAIFDASQRVPRAPSVGTGCVDVLGLVACAVVAVFMGLSDWNYFEGGPRPAPWQNTMNLSAALLGANASAVRVSRLELRRWLCEIQEEAENACWLRDELMGGGSIQLGGAHRHYQLEAPSQLQ